MTLMPRRQLVCEKGEKKRLGSWDETQVDRDRRLKQHGSRGEGRRRARQKLMSAVRN